MTAATASNAWRTTEARPTQREPPMSRADYRPFIPAPGQSPIAGATPRAHAEARLQRPRAKDLFGNWAKLAEAPFRGITTDGNAVPGLFSLNPEDAPTPAMVA